MGVVSYPLREHATSWLSLLPNEEEHATIERSVLDCLEGLPCR